MNLANSITVIIENTSAATMHPTDIQLKVIWEASSGRITTALRIITGSSRPSAIMMVSVG